MDGDGYVIGERTRSCACRHHWLRHARLLGEVEALREQLREAQEGWQESIQTGVDEALQLAELTAENHRLRDAIGAVPAVALRNKIRDCQLQARMAASDGRHEDEQGWREEATAWRALAEIAKEGQDDD